MSAPATTFSADEAKYLRRRACMDHANRVAGAVQFVENEAEWVEAFVKHHAEHFKEHEAEDRPHWEATKTWNLCNWQGTGNPRFMISFLEKYAPATTADEANESEYELLLLSLRAALFTWDDVECVNAMSEVLKNHILRGQEMIDDIDLKEKMQVVKQLVVLYDAGKLNHVSELKRFLKALSA